MKKLLLILICLFVSYEVKSKEVVLVCEVETILIFESTKGDYQIKSKSLFGGKDTYKIELYLDRKKRWLGTDKYNFKKNDIKITDDDKRYFSFETKDNREYYDWIEGEGEISIFGSYQYFFKKDDKCTDENLKYCYSFHETIRLDTQDGTVKIEKEYYKVQKMNTRRSFDSVSEGSIDEYNVVLKKGVCEKKKKKLF